jgi:hypothetical protein
MAEQEKETRTFKQTEDAAAGTTGFIFNGLYYASEAELDASLDEKQKLQRIPKGRLARSAGAQQAGSPNDLPGRSGSRVEQTEDIVTAQGSVNAPLAGPNIPSRFSPARAQKGAAQADLESLSKDELKELAAAKGVTVTRAGGGGEPTKAEYVAQLKGK